MIIAKCKEKNMLEAAMNGHLNIWPEAEIRFEDDWAEFFKNGEIIWSCNGKYGRVNFKIVEKDGV